MAKYDVTLHWILHLDPYESDEATDQRLFDVLGEYAGQHGLKSISIAIDGIGTLVERVNEEIAHHDSYRAMEMASGDYWVRGSGVFWYTQISITVDSAPVVLSQDPRGELALVAEIRRT